nr:terpene cyclase/mutase family protein [Pseudopedobacter sp.]
MRLKDSILTNDKSPLFYQYYPKLFATFYPQISDQQLNQLSEAGYLYYHATLLMDTLIDEKDFSYLSKMVLLQEESIKILTSIYGVKNDFWNYWNKRRDEYFEAAVIEKTITINNKVTKDFYYNLADKKAAFGKVAIDSLHVLVGKSENYTYHKLLISHKYFSVGFQLYDDVKDFSIDLKNEQFNWAIYQLKQEIDFENIPDFNLNKLLFIKGVGQKILKESILNFQNALDVLNNFGYQSQWETIIKETKQNIENYLDVTDGYILCLEKRISLKSERNYNHEFFKFQGIKNEVIKNGLKYINRDFSGNYSDLKHIMYLGDIDGFDNTSQVHITDTFQRAIVNDCLIEIASKNGLDISEFILNECEYLIKLVNKDKVGAWSYFSSVNEIAADIDDLGQIMQLFLKSDNKRLVFEYCLNAINIVLKDRTLSNGSFETWIINKEKQTPKQQKQEIFNLTKWGKGPDLEVVANFAYALFLFDNKLYKEYIQNALIYIINKQTIAGNWESRWYYGDYYGTYIVLKLLKHFEVDYPENISSALNFIHKTQNDDDGFGLDEDNISDPLTTSFAILSLKLFPNNYKECIVKAQRYLIMSQNKEGFWSEVAFIKPKVHEPYKSKTLTTAFVLNALC